MTDDIIETELRIADLSGPGRTDAVRDTVRRLDADATVTFEPTHDLVRIRSRAQSLEIADALAKAGLAPSAMTG